MRWIWIDHFDEFHSGQSARAVKVVSVAEDHLHEQFPGYPVMPHSLIIEGLAQTGGILVGEANDFSEKVVLAKIPKVTFHDHAIAGDVLHYEVELVELRGEGGIVDAKVFKNGELMVESEIVFAHLDKSRGIDDGLSAKNFVFTKDHLMGLLRMAQGSYQGGGGGASRGVEETHPTSDAVGNNGRP
ncbi:3-hydroxyacyl-[acyl-carrier-protein] dehydratase FabZ [Planctomycetes bacterium Pan216]|uniref:3-hydroxyacyl-[acyl-carrier-protein] dehydratase FabZ n=1 Tax=Kolteria novifilia TaxID=2527975 RepID=A0A518BAE3_9BACT|nr:3-hydroxyacyl-[acyl-carrier-protein] dehydratase FabZ [Planctomycetes bacterium Pan216]